MCALLGNMEKVTGVTVAMAVPAVVDVRQPPAKESTRIV